MSKIADKKIRTYDPVQLEAMTEPFTVRVERLRGNTRSPIPLWQTGAEWTKEEIQNLETNLVTNWSGGGLYAITVVDSSVPEPKRLDWSPYYDSNAFPERTPPPLEAATVGAVNPSNPPPSSVLNPSPARPMPNSLFPNPLRNTQVPMSQFQNPYYGQAPTFFPQTAQPYTPAPVAVSPASAAQQAAALAEMERKQAQEELRAMREQLAKQREDMLAEKHRAELERARTEQQTQIDSRFAKLEQLLVTSAQQAAARPTGPDPALEAMKEQLRAAEARAEQDRRDRETERRERDLKDAMMAQAENTRREMEALKLLLTNTNKGPDPVLMMFQESTRMQIEAMKEQSRAQAAAAERANASALAPRDIIALMKDSSQGVESVTKNIVGVYNDMFSVQRQMIETAAQLNAPPGDSIPSLIREGVERFGSLAERYQSSKSKEVVATVQAQAQVEQAKIQAAMLAQNPQLAMAAQREQQGATTLAEAPAAPVPAAIAVPSIATAADNGPKRKGRTDAEWFGVILPRVEQLRSAVATHIEAATANPPKVDKDGKLPGLDPEATAGVVAQATAMAVNNNIAVPALIDLLVQERVADFFDVLLPDAPQAYRDAAAAALLDMADGDDEGDEGAGDEDGEDEEEAPIVAAPPVKVAPKNGKRAST